VEPERAALRIAAADCLFLAKDFALAEKAYAGLQQEAADIRLAEDAFHQRVLCLLETSEDDAAWQRVAAVIEETSRSRRTRAGEPVWSASWSLVEDARKSGHPAEAEKLLARLRPVIADAGVEYALRFTWQSALLAIAQGRPAQAASLAQDIDRRLENLPADPSLGELRKAVPELRGHAALLKARTALNAGSAQGLDELVGLRRRFGKVPAAAALLPRGRTPPRLRRPGTPTRRSGSKPSPRISKANPRWPSSPRSDCTKPRNRPPCRPRPSAKGN
jgi:hypothetical protein